MATEQQIPHDARPSQTDHSRHASHIQPGRTKATMLGLIMVFALRKRIREQCHADLRATDVERLIEVVEEGELNQSILGILHDASQRTEPVPAALATLLTHEDPVNKPFELHDEPASEDERSLAVGFCIRMDTALHGTEAADERDTVHANLTGERASSHRCDMVFRVLSTIHSLLNLQDEIDRKHHQA
ncbi:hypothetical protein KIH77_02935 [Bifidobacterium sp. 82T24]|uniref:hypothetical protein n=1 Tax=Bifidobacterium pluvialisilvae TaxID=2834436 RepID=UPI001C59E47D|nr:hypothetical protein [Bifidobacterium pluvialisilvae]MBW3087691.1 hypothetical protein [Bifidobacterium pluvialisilvae]